MVGRKGAAIVNQSSMSAYMSIGAYSISKLALIGLTTALAREFSGDGIRVNAIAPGLIVTEATTHGMDKGIKDYVLGNQLIKRFGSTADMVSTVHYLCSPESSFMTGQTLRVDGGYILHP
jgi:3-oxoacyl-[acyl-carrier protein] reductase